MVAYPEIVEALLRPEAYPESVTTVELVETHISYLFLTGKHVYKVKKPVNYGFLDFSTLEKRRYYCQEEVELNRRLSPEVYLGVSEIRQHQGRYTVDGPGITVEYAVRMRQLPREGAMNVLLQQGQVSEEDIRRLASKIAGFHARAATNPEITRLGSLKTVRQNVQENYGQIERFIGTCLSQDSFDDLVAYSSAFMAARESLFQQRAEEGCIRDCHGDLHTAQIFLEEVPDGDGISIIDCIEFNHRFRYSDVAADIAFLAMDLDFHGRPDLSRTFVEAYIQASGDPGVLELLDFSKAYRACVRGKVTAFRLDDPQLFEETRQQTQSTARAYFQLAHTYTQVFPHPTLILVTGLSGTGKSTVAQELARRWDLAHVSSDVSRKALAGIGPQEHRYDPFGEGIYSAEFSRRTYEAMLEQAEQVLKIGRSVVLDATFRRGEERSRAVALGQQAGVEIWLVECCLPEEEARRRLEQRLRRGDSVSDGRWEIFAQQQREWEPVVEVPSYRHIRLDTSATPVETMRQLLHQLYTRAIEEVQRTAGRMAVPY